MAAAKQVRGRPKSVPHPWIGNREMKHSDFRIGCEFLTGSGRWRCTDVGKRTVAAIRLNHDDDPSGYNGPPYAVVEHVFDEEAIKDCEVAPRRRTYDDSGKTEIVSFPRSRLPAAKSRKRPARTA
jgi:hypothetical protein